MTHKMAATCVWWLGTIHIILQFLHGISANSGGYISRDTTYTKNESPHKITRDIDVPKGVKLTIEPGTELRFSPGIGATIRGILQAQGTPSDRITFTADSVTSPPKWPQDVRLVGEHTVMRGILQINYNKRWRYVCSNYRNWTETDSKVVCNHLGFLTGNFTFNTSSANFTHHMMYERPQCNENDSNILNCKGKTDIKSGGKICENQEVVGFKCTGLAPNFAPNHWRGLAFINSTVLETTVEHNINLNLSASILEYVDITYAGVDKKRNGVAAIWSNLYPPRMKHVLVSHNALDGVNFTDTKDNYELLQTKISNNRGHGLVAWPRHGTVSVRDSEIENNSGDGIHTVMNDPRYWRRHFARNEFFCIRPHLPGAYFPMIVPGEANVTRTCNSKFVANQGQVLTIDFLYMDKDPVANASIVIHDGSRIYDPVLTTVEIKNGTAFGLPQSITTSRNSVYIRFNWKVPDYPKYPLACRNLTECVRFVIKISAGKEGASDMKIYDSKVNNNIGRGVYLQDGRSILRVNNSQFDSNQYAGGLHVANGSLDIHVNYTKLRNNAMTGVNITTAGGRKIFKGVTALGNQGIGIYVGSQQGKNKTRHEREQRTEITRSFVNNNTEIGIKFGNFCTNSIETVVNFTAIEFNKIGIVSESCQHELGFLTNFTVRLNTFVGNWRQAIQVTPMVNMIGQIWDNSFTGQSQGCILIDNTNDFVKNRFYKDKYVNYEIFRNTFNENSGAYMVNLQLTPPSIKQKLVVWLNKFSDNSVQDAFKGLNPRSRANAVLIVSSDNINVYRNFISNPKSVREMTTHLLDQTASINATHNYWATTDHKTIFFGLLDQMSRYNLAKIKYFPALQHSDLDVAFTTQNEREYILSFGRGNVLGGVLNPTTFSPTQTFTTTANTEYFVDRDIYVPRDKTFVINEGTTLVFDTSVGMLVDGDIQVKGMMNTKVNFSDNWHPTFNNESTIRIVGKSGDMDVEGRVEVQIDNEWGTICNVGWNIQDASVVCASLGYTVHPSNWQPTYSLDGQKDLPIWLSNVQCTEEATDVTKCDADQLYDHSCDHSMDVVIHCTKPTWAGIRLTTAASKKESRLQHLVVERGGLMDYAIQLYKSSIQIDMNRHIMQDIRVSDSVSSGIAIMHNEIFKKYLLERVEISDNLVDGIVTRSSFLEIANATIENNKGAGIHYDPKFTEYEAWDIRSWVHKTSITVLTPGVKNIQVGEQPVYIVTELTADSVNREQIVEIKYVNDARYKLTLTVLDYNPNTKEEEIIIYNGQAADITKPVGFRPANWTIERDLVDFPVVSGTNVVTMKYIVRGKISGRLAISARAVPSTNRKPLPTLTIHDSMLRGNRKGLVVRNYNQPSNDKLELMYRHFAEEIHVYRLTIRDSKEEAIHIPSITKFNELVMPSFTEFERPARVANISYKIHNCKIINNEKAVLAEHNHVEFSNNVWHWRFYDNIVQHNRNGGLSIELPRVLDAGERLNSSIDVNNTIFSENTNFEFALRGFHCNVTMYHNTFQKNTCKARKGLILISGMEKNIQIHENIIKDNTGHYMVEFDLRSHIENATVLPAKFTRNIIQNNRKPGPPTADNKCLLHIYPSTYTLSVRGVQRVLVNRNLLGQNDMEFELVANVPSSYLMTKLNVKENWWGTTNQTVLRHRIFDFDDWNSYTVADFHPYLVTNSFSSSLTTESLKEVMLDVNKQLGGRITSDLYLTKRPEPYRVVSDITVMPGVTLRIESGVTFELNPNVGILVLGDMLAEGTESEHIKFKPVERDQICSSALTNPSYDTVEAMGVRLVGSSRSDEGFVEMWNSTIKKWSLICDKQFHLKTAQVLCRTMGKDSNNAHVRFSDLYDYYVNGYRHPVDVPRYYWRRSFQCTGQESKWEECITSINYNLHSCMAEKRFAFIRCGMQNLDRKYDYWGNIRFATESFESGKIDKGTSVLRYVEIYGAGMLHGEKAAAVQAIHRTPLTGNVTITYSAGNGFDFVAPKGQVEVSITEVADNLGYGVGVLVLNGESRTSEQSSFEALNDSTVPYNTFALVQMCDSEKVITIKERILLYYKYSYDRIDCVKIIKSITRVKRMGIRFLQYKIHNDNFTENAIEIFDGSYINGSRKLTTLRSNSTMKERMKLYQSTKYEDSLTVHIHASPADESYGFIAEVITLPLSPQLNQKSVRHSISTSRIRNNQGGAIQYMNVGEINPELAVTNNWIENNGIAILNFTSIPTMCVNIQNTQRMTIRNNYIAKNKGGLTMYAVSNSVSTALDGNITNNVFYKNTNGTVAGIMGHHYQRMLLTKNYFSFNDVTNEDAHIVHLSGVITNMTRNVIHNNTGYHVVHLHSTDNVGVNQTLTDNHIYWNNATDINVRTTIFAENVWQKITNNFLLNQFNNFELATNNITWLKYYCYQDPSSQYCQTLIKKYYLKPWDPRLDPYNNINHIIQLPLVATGNWWGSDSMNFIESRVWDGRDDNHLFNASYDEFLPSNRSLLEGNCQPGWKLYKSLCFQYMGGYVSHQVAKEHCEFEGGVIATTREMKFNLGQLVANQQLDYNVRMGAWVDLNDEDVLDSQLGKCHVLFGYSTQETSCSDLYGYICQKVPIIFIENPSNWVTIAIVGGSVGGVSILLVLLLVFCLCMKKKQRKEEQFKRRDSIRSSIRTNRSAVNGGFNSIARRRKENYDNTMNATAAGELSIQRTYPYKVSGATLDETADDNLDKLKLEQLHASTPNGSSFNMSASQHSLNSGVGLQSFAPRLENEIANIMRRPLYDSVYQNAGYDDSSFGRSLDHSRDNESDYGAKPSSMNVSLPNVFENKGYFDNPLNRSTDSSVRTLPAYTPQKESERERIPSYASMESLSHKSMLSDTDSASSIQKPPPMETDF